MAPPSVGLSMGKETLVIPLTLYRKNRQKLAAMLNGVVVSKPSEAASCYVVLLQVIEGLSRTEREFFLLTIFCSAWDDDVGGFKLSCRVESLICGIAPTTSPSSGTTPPIDLNPLQNLLAVFS